jgi:integrase
VDPLTAKKRRERYVDMSDNLIEWLAPYVRTSGKIGYSRMLFCKTKTAANVDWSKDVMRHSFGSYLLASNNDAGKTSLQMGHTGNEILFKNYRSIIEEASAITEYWSITPNQKTGIIQMPIAKAG